MKIIVTGASGFLGRALVLRLKQGGAKVLGVSRGHYIGTHKVERYEDTPAGDILIHLAETSDRALVQANGPLYEQTALNILEALHSKGFSRVIYASSAVVYGDQEPLPRKEDDPVYATDAYTRLKLAAERAVLARNGVVARLANIYGPGMAKGNVLSTILGQLKKEGPVRVIDDTPVRDFLWVEDAARALANMVSGTASGVFNVGSGCGVSIHELAREVLGAAGQLERRIESTRPGKSCSRLILDIAKTELAFGWQPAVPLFEGIGNLVKVKVNVNVGKE